MAPFACGTFATARRGRGGSIASRRTDHSSRWAAAPSLSILSIGPIPTGGRHGAPPATGEHGTTETHASGLDEILVGDFSSSDLANEAAARIESAIDLPATVVDATQAPAVLGPGVWAVIVPITSDDPEADLARFRQALPDLADWSWVVSI